MKRNSPPPPVSPEELELQKQEFFRKGGKIQYIPEGVQAAPQERGVAKTKHVADDI